MLLMVEKGIRGGISHAIHRYAAGNNKKMKNDNKNNESSYIMYLGANSLMGNVSKITSLQFSVPKFNEKLVKIYDEISDKDTFLKQMLNALKGFMIITMI